MWKWINIFLVGVLIPSMALAKPAVSGGAFTYLKKGETIRFDAWCYDEFANAQILSDIQLTRERCKSSTQRELEVQREKFELEMSKLQHRLRTEILNSTQALLAKDRQIDTLEETALKTPNDYSIWWAGGGFAAGILLSVGIVYAIK